MSLLPHICAKLASMHGFCLATLCCRHTHHHQQMLCSETSHLPPCSLHLHFTCCTLHVYTFQNTLTSPCKKRIPSDRDVLMGSLAGALHEVIVDEKDKKEKVAKRVFQLQDSKDQISSVYQHQASPGHRMVLMATSKRLYVFSGKGGLETMFARYTSPGMSIFVQSIFVHHILSVVCAVCQKDGSNMQGVPFYEVHCSVHFFVEPLLCLQPVLLLSTSCVICSVKMHVAAQITSFSCQPGSPSILHVNQVPTKMQTSLPASHWSRPT